MTNLRQPITSDVERRYISAAAGATLRADEPAEGRELPRLHGVACPFDSLSVELWRDYDSGKPIHERFVRGAFAEVLAGNPDIIVPRDHDPMHLLGRTSSGTASVEETDEGLAYWVDPPNTEDGRTVVELIRRRDVAGSSFAFIPGVVSWREEGDRIIRTVERVKGLFDVSPVTWPAYPASSVASRSLDALQAELATWRQGANAWAAACNERRLRLIEAGL